MNTSISLVSDNESHDCETPSEQLRKSTKIEYPNEILRNLRLTNVNMLTCAQLNISSVRNKYDLLTDIVNNKIDILMISETKLYSSFPTRQFHIHGFSEPCRFDRNSSGGRLLLYVWDDVPSNYLGKWQ